MSDISFEDRDRFGLSDEEIAALEGDDTEDTVDATEGDDIQDDASDVTDVDGDPDTSDADAGDSAVDDSGGDDGVVDADGDDSDTGAAPEDAQLAVPDLAPQIQVPDLEELQQKREALRERARDIGQRYADGELSEAEYAEANVELNFELSALDGEIAVARSAAEFNKATAEATTAQDWERTKAEFFSNPANQIYKEGSVAFDLLDAELRKLGSDEEAQKLSNREALQRADQAVRERLQKDLGVNLDGQAQDSKPAQKEADPAPEPQAEQKTDEITSRESDLQLTREAPKIPPTLSGIPSSEVTDRPDRYADLDALADSGDPESVYQLEAILSRMSPEEQAAYLDGLA